MQQVDTECIYKADMAVMASVFIMIAWQAQK